MITHCVFGSSQLDAGVDEGNVSTCLQYFRLQFLTIMLLFHVGSRTWLLYENIAPMEAAGWWCAGCISFFFVPIWPQTWTNDVNECVASLLETLMVSVFHVVQVEVYSVSLKRAPNCGAQNGFEVFLVIVPASHREEKQTFVRGKKKKKALSLERYLYTVFLSYSKYLKILNVKVCLDPVVVSLRPAVAYRNRPWEVFSLPGTRLVLDRSSNT